MTTDKLHDNLIYTEIHLPEKKTQHFTDKRKATEIYCKGSQTVISGIIIQYSYTEIYLPEKSNSTFRRQKEKNN
jgi:hypothetical protein